MSTISTGSSRAARIAPATVGSGAGSPPLPSRAIFIIPRLLRLFFFRRNRQDVPAPIEAAAHAHPVREHRAGALRTAGEATGLEGQVAAPLISTRLTMFPFRKCHADLAFSTHAALLVQVLP